MVVLGLCWLAIAATRRVAEIAIAGAPDRVRRLERDAHAAARRSGLDGLASYADVEDWIRHPY